MPFTILYNWSASAARLLFMLYHQNTRIDSSSLELNLTTTLLINVVHRRVPLAACGWLEDCWRLCQLQSAKMTSWSWRWHPQEDLPWSCVAPPRTLLPGLPPLHQGLPRELERGDQAGCCYPGLHYLGPAGDGGVWQPHQEPPGPPDHAKLNQQDGGEDGQGWLTPNLQGGEREMRRIALPSLDS